MKKSFSFILLSLLAMCLNGFSQSLSTAQAQYNEFVRLYSSSGESINAYNALYMSYEQYYSILNTSTDDYSKAQAKAGLKAIFPYLNSGAYFFTDKNNNVRTVQFVEAYLNVYMHQLMASEGLQVGSDLATFSWMAATNNYNSKKYDKAILFLQAYINSGEAKKRQDAYNYMAKAYTYLKDYNHAKYILEQGLSLYPDNLGMLTTIINMLGESKSDDATLQKYVTQALVYKPNDEGLINIQAQLFERTNNFTQAIFYYNRLMDMHPNNLDVARHLSINYYNAGVDYAKKADISEKKSVKNQYKKQASDFFSSASKYLNDVLYSDPLAINYALALANAYAYLGENVKLQDINQKITALGQTPVSNIGNMQLMAYNNSHATPGLVAPTPVPNIPTPAAEEKPVAKPQPAPSTLSDVDINIPTVSSNNKNTFAVIIANVIYTNVANVPNAENDGNVFAEYCNKVLGISKTNIRKYLNTTLGDLVEAIEDIKGISDALRGKCNIIFYYAGHGVPNERDKTAYLLPVDADGRQTRVCYALNDLYSELSSLNAENTTVFLDACFSGATRDNKMIASARGIAIDVDESEVKGKIAVFSAASGDQTALSYDDKHHGMFTYFLLKKLKESEGNVTMQELGDYITQEVKLNARLVNRKDQTPTVTLGSGYGAEWKSKKLK